MKPDAVLTFDDFLAAMRGASVPEWSSLYPGNDFSVCVWVLATHETPYGQPWYTVALDREDDEDEGGVDIAVYAPDHDFGVYIYRTARGYEAALSLVLEEAVNVAR